MENFLRSTTSEIRVPLFKPNNTRKNMGLKEKKKVGSQAFHEVLKKRQFMSGSIKRVWRVTACFHLLFSKQGLFLLLSKSKQSFLFVTGKYFLFCLGKRKKKEETAVFFRRRLIVFLTNKRILLLGIVFPENDLRQTKELSPNLNVIIVNILYFGRCTRSNASIWTMDYFKRKSWRNCKSLNFLFQNFWSKSWLFPVSLFIK